VAANRVAADRVVSKDKPGYLGKESGGR
jgi:hypothetical protein